MRLKLTCKSCSRNIEIEGETTVAAIKCPNCEGTINLPSNILDVDSVLGGFKVIRHLGSGSMGCVYLATQVSMEREVAIKVLPPEIKEHEDELKNFLKEVRLLAKLDHPNIVTAFEAGEDDGNYYMAMTYVQGETLEDKIAREGPLNEVEALTIAHKVAEALQYAWDKHQILHRDVKPENIMLDERSKDPKLLDMGISKALNDDAEHSVDKGLLVGTPHYMSPEQATAQGELDFRSDMYSLGCSLYQFLTGNVPFDADNVMQVLSKHALDPIPSPLKYNNKLHPNTVELLRRMMAKRPADRFDKWEDLLLQIRKIINAIKHGKGKLSTKTGRQPKERRTVVEDDISGDDFPNTDELFAAASELKARNEPQETPSDSKLIKRLLVVIMVMLGAAILLFAVMNIKAMMRSDSSTDATSSQGDGSSETDEEVARRTEEARRKLEASRAARNRKNEEATGAERERIGKLEERFKRLVTREPAKPVSFGPLLITYRKFLEDVRGTTVEQKVSDHIAALEKRRETEPVLVMNDLKRTAARHLKDRNYDAAIRLYRSYDGHCAGETVNERRALVSQLRNQRSRLEDAKHVEALLVERAAYHLCQGNFDKVFAEIKEAKEKTVVNEELVDFIRSVASMNTVILNSYRDQTGREITVTFRKGKATLSINDVVGDTVKAFKKVKIGESTGRLPRDFTLKEVHPSELARRLTGASHDVQPLMKGLLALESKKYSTAKSYFASTTHPLGQTLQTYVDIRSDGVDRSADREFDKLLARLEIRRDDEESMIKAVSGKTYVADLRAELKQTAEIFLMRFGKSKVVKANRLFFFQLMGALGMVHELDTEKMDRYLNHIKDINKLKDLKAAFDGIVGGVQLDLSSNAGLVELSKLSAVDVCELSLAHTGFRDPSDLQSANLRVLNLSHTPVKSIKGLRNYELMSLDLADTSIDELPSMKRYGSLKSLSLRNTPLKSVRPLIGVPIEELDIRGCSAIEDLGLLARVPTLRTIYVSRDIKNLWSLSAMTQLQTVGWTNAKPQAANQFWSSYRRTAEAQIRSEYGPKLRAIIQEIARDVPLEREWESASALLGRCRYYPDGISISFRHVSYVKDLSLLAGIPVVALNIERTGVTDLSPLQGAPLKRLSMYRTQVPTLKPLANCPLEEIYFRSTPVEPEELATAWPNLNILEFDGGQLSDLNFLKGKQLSKLAIYGGKYSRPDPLLDQPLVNLRLTDNPIRSLMPFSKIATLEHLYLPGTKVSSATPLKDLELVSIDLSSTDVKDLSPLADCPLKHVWFNDTKVTRINFLAGKSLETLAMNKCEIRDISILKDMPIRTLHIGETTIRDYSPLATLKGLRELWLYDTGISDLTVLNGMPIGELRLDGCKSVTTLEALGSLRRLNKLTIPRRDVDGLGVVRGIPGLEYLSDRYDGWTWRTRVGEFFGEE